MPAPDTDNVYVLVKLSPYIGLCACVKKHFKLKNYVYTVHGKKTEMLQLAQYCSYQKLSKSQVPLKSNIKATSFSDIFGSEQN